MKIVALHPSDYLPRPPERKDYGIGFIGCGGIVLGSHLPAYGKLHRPLPIFHRSKSHPRESYGNRAARPAAVSPMFLTILMEFPPESQLMAVSYFNNIVRAPALHQYSWFIDGTDASAMASDNEITVALRENPDHSQTFQIQGQWFPDAFGGSMGELMRALTEGREPETSGRDNLSFISIAYAAVESTVSGEAVEIM